MSIITQEQRSKLENNIRFQELTKQYAKERGTYLAGQNENSIPNPFGGLTAANWAKQVFIGSQLLMNPSSQAWTDWVLQFSSFLKGANVWVNDADPLPAGGQPGDATVTAMIASGKFDELAELTYALRSLQIYFLQTV